MIRIKNLKKCFSRNIAIKEINSKFNVGDVISIIGPNGVGKSTFLKMLSGFLYPSSGKINFFDKKFSDHPIFFKKNIGYLSESSSLYEYMTVIEYLFFVSRIRKLKRKYFLVRLNYLSDILDISNILHKKMNILSKGYKKRIGIAQSIMHDPLILILDEPTDGLDPYQKNKIMKFINIIRHKKLVIFTTHILEEVKKISNRVIILYNNKIKVDTHPKSILFRNSKFIFVKLKIKKKKKNYFRMLK